MNNQQIHSRNYHLKLRKNNICTGCRKPSIPGKSLCAECAAKVSEKAKNRRLDRAANGLCTECGIIKVQKFKMCLGCRKVEALKNRCKYENRKSSR